MTPFQSDKFLVCWKERFVAALYAMRLACTDGGACARRSFAASPSPWLRTRRHSLLRARGFWCSLASAWVATNPRSLFRHSERNGAERVSLVGVWSIPSPLDCLRKVFLHFECFWGSRPALLPTSNPYVLK
jgi:hypothetical protein